MTLANLSEVLIPAKKEGYAVAGLVCLGWEDTRAYVHAAEEEGLPVILQAGPGCRKHTPLPVIAAMFRTLAEPAGVPVVLHLDHGTEKEECHQAIEEGFTSVMFDGSRLPLQENIEKTFEIAELAKLHGVSSEGEIGFVGYYDGAASTGTDPEEAAQFAFETNVDAIAVSVGNVHLQETSGSGLDEELLKQIEKSVDTPLVIHGGSGVAYKERKRLAHRTNICKFNIGTELRMAFGSELRTALSNYPESFDRNEILNRVETPLIAAARRIIRGIGPSN